MRTVRRAVLIVLLVILGCSLIGLLGGVDWFCDLFNAFRPQAVLGAILLLVPAIIRRWRSAIAVGLVIVVLNVGLMGTRMLAFGGAEEADAASAPVTLLSANLLASNKERQWMLDLIAREQPDIVVVLEASHNWADAFKRLPARYAYKLTEPRFGVFGIAAYSRLPFTGHVIYVGDQTLPLLHLDFGAYVVLAAHPPPPITTALAAEQRVYIEEIAYQVKLADKPVIVAGDFNGTLWNASMRPLSRAGLMSGHPSGLAWTWPSGLAPLAMQIDHLFVHGATVKDFRVLPGIGSDHFPVMASFVPLDDR